MSICDGNITTQPFNEGVILEQIKRDYGLTSINNINGGVVGCVEVFDGPTFTSNLTKLTTGMTETSNGVFNISNGAMTFDYTFTGGTDVLTAYTGSFGYLVYGRPLLSGFTNQVDSLTSTSTEIDTFEDVLIYSASTNFSTLTLSGFSFTDEFLNIKSDSEYVLNSNFSFTANECLRGGLVTGENLGNIYDDEFSLYFVTIENPTAPTLGPFQPLPPQTPGILTTIRETIQGEESYVFSVPQVDDVSENNPNCQLVTETLTISTVSPDTFTLEYKPYDATVMVSVNGITLSKNDYTITDFVIITLTKLLSPTMDTITITYLSCDRDIDSITSELYQITGVTSGTTSAVTTTDKVYFNTDYSKYEYYTDSEIIDAENTIIYLNGVKLTYGLDYYESISSNNRIIFDSTTLSVSDVIHILYNVGDNIEGDYGTIGGGDSSLMWRVEPPTVNSDRLSGNFIMEITEASDKDFTSTATTIQTIVAYIDGATDYNGSIPSTLDAKKTYIWRVISNKVYSGLLDNTYITTNISKIGKFFTNNTINSY